MSEIERYRGIVKKLFLRDIVESKAAQPKIQVGQIYDIFDRDGKELGSAHVISEDEVKIFRAEDGKFVKTVSVQRLIDGAKGSGHTLKRQAR